MDEKLGIRFRKMQNATINAKLFIFCILFEKGSSSIEHGSTRTFSIFMATLAL